MKFNLSKRLKRAGKPGQLVKNLQGFSTSTEQPTDSDSKHLKNSENENLLKPSPCIRLIEDLPALTYVIIVTSGDIKHLGGGNDEERFEAWELIQDQIEQFTNTGKTIGIIEAEKEIKMLILQIDRIAMIIAFIELLGLTDDLMAELAAEYIYINSVNQLQYAVNQSKQLNIRLATLKAQQQLSPQGGNKVNKAMYVSLCKAFSDVHKYRIVLEDLNTLEFFEYYKELNEYIDRQNKSATMGAW